MGLVGDREIPAVAGTPVEEGCMVQIEHKRSAGERGRPAGGNLVVEGKGFLAVRCTVVEGRVRPVVEDKVNPGMVVADSRAGNPHSWNLPEVVETAWFY